MRPTIIIVVGYITGLIWGRYLKTSIAPVIFLLFLGIYLISNRSSKLEKRDSNWISKLKEIRKYIIISLIFAIVSNIQIMYLENRFNTLYINIKETKLVGIITSIPKETEYRNSYTLKVQSINGDEKYKNTNLIIYTKKDIKLEYGKKVEIIRRI